MDRTSSNSLLDACGREFAIAGFLVPARGRIIYPLDAEVFGWVGLNQFNSHDAITYYPFVGIHHQRIMETVARAQGEKYVKGQTATYAVPFNSLPATPACFRIGLGVQSADQVKLMVERVAEVAVPFMRNISALESLIPLMRSRERMLGGYPERVAAALLISGQLNELTSYLQERRDTYKADTVNPDSVVRWDSFTTGLSAERREVRANNSFKPKPLRGSA